MRCSFVARPGCAPTVNTSSMPTICRGRLHVSRAIATVQRGHHCLPVTTPDCRHVSSVPDVLALVVSVRAMVFAGSDTVTHNFLDPVSRKLVDVLAVGDAVGELVAQVVPLVSFTSSANDLHLLFNGAGDVRVVHVERERDAEFVWASSATSPTTPSTTGRMATRNDLISGIRQTGCSQRSVTSARWCDRLRRLARTLCF